MDIRPQAGPQELFLSTQADICIYGGAAGGGKSYALLLEPLRHIKNKSFSAMLFRRTSPPITAPGGVWDESGNIYPYLGGRSLKSPTHTWIFPSGARIVMSHLQYDDTVYSYQGAQIPLIMYDELTHFSWKQFQYMLSRNRSATAGIKPYIRCTCNPDPDSWVSDMVEWYIDQETGYPIPERRGVIRWFVVDNDEMQWADKPEELFEKYKVWPKSFTFIAANLSDNKILMEKDPGYLSNLNALDTVSREQLLSGNWKIRPSAGLYFKASQFQVVDQVPSRIVAICRAWDLAATEKTPTNKSPDQTAGVMIARMADNRYIVLDARGGCYSASNVRQMIRSTGSEDVANWRCNHIGIPQDPGQAGKEQGESYVRFLAGHSVWVHTVSGSKVVRAEPFAAQVQQGNVLMLKGPWNKPYTREMESFPDGAHDDFVDASSDAFSFVAKYRDLSGVVD